MSISSNRLSTTLMKFSKLLSSSTDEKISNESRTLYQRKIESILFVAISSRSNVSFAVSRLSRFNYQSEKTHHHATNRVLQYLYHTRDYCIRYDENSNSNSNRDLISFVCVSDVSFVDNILNRKSSQDYIMKLFNETVS
jgi:hypothetical protein